jgi:hypothetical protein
MGALFEVAQVKLTPIEGDLISQVEGGRRDMVLAISHLRA